MRQRTTRQWIPTIYSSARMYCYQWVWADKQEQCTFPIDLGSCGRIIWVSKQVSMQRRGSHSYNIHQMSLNPGFAETGIGERTVVAYQLVLAGWGEMKCCMTYMGDGGSGAS